MLRERIVKSSVNQEVSELGMAYPVNEYGEIARRVITFSLLGASRVEVQTSVHMNDTGPKGADGNSGRMLQHILPVSEGRGRRRVRLAPEAVKAPSNQ
jgi:hypothetical protein